MNNKFFIVEKKTRKVQKEETYDYKYLDQRKVYEAMEKATTADELILLLKVLQEDDDIECDHIIADEIVVKALRLLGQFELAEEYEKVSKWYA